MGKYLCTCFSFPWFAFWFSLLTRWIDSNDHDYSIGITIWNYNKMTSVAPLIFSLNVMHYNRAPNLWVMTPFGGVWLCRGGGVTKRPTRNRTKKSRMERNHWFGVKFSFPPSSVCLGSTRCAASAVPSGGNHGGSRPRTSRKPPWAIGLSDAGGQSAEPNETLGVSRPPPRFFFIDFHRIEPSICLLSPPGRRTAPPTPRIHRNRWRIWKKKHWDFVSKKNFNVVDVGSVTDAVRLLLVAFFLLVFIFFWAPFSIWNIKEKKRSNQKRFIIRFRSATLVFLLEILSNGAHKRRRFGEMQIAVANHSRSFFFGSLFYYFTSSTNQPNNDDGGGPDDISQSCHCFLFLFFFFCIIFFLCGVDGVPLLLSWCCFRCCRR